MQVLLQLMDAGGEVVTREELFEHCWNGIFVGDDSLNRAIFELRRALRAAGASVTIETIPKTGYRLIGLPLSYQLKAKEPPTAPVALSRRVLIGGAASVAAAGGAGLLTWRYIPSAQERKAADLVERADIIWRDDLDDSAERSAGLYRAALKLTPDDASIWGKLALALQEIAEYGPPEQTAKAVMATEVAARHALQLQAAQADARVALTMLPPHFGKWLPVERALRGILADAPENMAAQKHLGVVLMEVGCVTLGAAIIDRLVESEPLSPDLQYRHVYQLWARGRVRDADQVADKALQLWPHHSSVWLARMWLFALTGRPTTALAMIDNKAGLPEFAPSMVRLLRLCCTALATHSQRDIAAAVDANIKAAQQGPFGVVSSTLTLPQLGAADVALQINRGYLLREGPFVGLLSRPADQPPVSQQSRRKTMALWMPSSGPMRALSGFLPLCAATGMTDYWRQSGQWPDFLHNRPPA
jgi:tetratricopeptide (TPR) repeat protein